MNKRLYIRAAMLLLAVLATTTVWADRLPVGTVIATGTCGKQGDNLTWTLTANGERPYDSVHKTQCDGITMTISGTGEMADNSFSVILNQALSNVYPNEELTLIKTKRISNVIIEEGVTSIGSNAFSGFMNMRRITLPSTLTSISLQAFMNCDALKSVDIPDNVTSIGNGVFQECDSLRSVSLSAGIKTIPINTFKNCVRLMTLRLKRYVPGDPNPITVFTGNYNSTGFAFYNCAALATLIVPKEGMETYQSSVSYVCWQTYPFFKAKDKNNNDELIYFKYILRPDCDILFEAGTTNRWTTWADKVNHAAPKGAEVYTIYNVENGEVTLNRITARVTLPETMREGAGDDGVRDLVPAFVPVLIKRPDGTLTEDLTMPYVMGGDLILENGWFSPHSGNPSIWSKEQNGPFHNDADITDYVPTVFPDVMANAPYGYPKGLSYDIHPFGFSASGSASGLNDPNNDSGIRDVVGGTTLDNSIFYGNADKNSLSECSKDLKNFGGRTAYAFENDAFRPMTDAEKEGKLASHQCALLVSERTTYPDQLTLSINERVEVTLSDNADNTTAIEAAARLKNTRVTLSGHTFFLDGDWNTLCLPFKINLITDILHRDQLFQFFGNNGYGTGSPDDAIVMELDTRGEYNGKKTGLDDDGTLNLYFKKANVIEAGKPYLVKWLYRVEYSISNPVFYDAQFAYVPPTPDLIINSVNDWNTFAQNVNNGTESYEGKLVRLDANLDGVTTMVGTNSNKFNGTFDGNGHTLDLALVGTAQCTAPFSYVLGATIKNLRTTGKVTLSGTQNYHASGLVGSGQGVTIENCHVSAAIQFPSGTGNVYSGGIIGHSCTGIYTMTNCLFDGSIGYVDGGTGTMENVGGLVGWGDKSTPNITYCLNAGTFANPERIAMIARGEYTGNISHCYSTTNTTSNGDRYINAGTYTTATGSDLLALLGDGWTMSGNDVVPVVKTYGAPSDVHPVTFPGGKFVGNYDPYTVAKDNEIIYLGSNNKIGYAAKGKVLRPFRAHFELTASPDPSQGGGNSVKEIILNFDGEDSATSLSEELRVKSAPPAPELCEEEFAPAAGWFTIDGRKLEKQPTAKGIYIHGGKKIVVR